MTHTLVSVLGKARNDPKTGYHPVTYRFPDGREFATPFFGLALKEYLKSDCLVILGTEGSMWDVLVEYLAIEGQEEELRLELIEAATHGRVSQSLIDQIRTPVERALGITCRLRLIPYGRAIDEQIDILSTVAKTLDEIGPKGRVSLDLTHGFRHLAALGLLSGFFLERVAGIQIAGLYYGAFDMIKDGSTPVVCLDGLMSIQRWISALDRYDQSGDYGVFTALLSEDGVPEDKARCLKEAAFFERTFNLTDAIRKIRTFLPTLDASLPGAAGLFQQQLARRLDWARRDNLFEHQRHLAYLYLERHDYVRAVIFGWEALVTRACQEHGLNPLDRSGREAAIGGLDDEIRADKHSSNVRDAYWMLKNLRNALAHGNPPQDERCRRIIANPEQLPRVLRRAFEQLRR